MKLITDKTILLILIAFLLAVVANPLTAQVYKSVDEDGNVTYTDQAPKEGAKPVKLRPISVIEAPTYQVKPKPSEASAEGEDGKEMSLKYLRKNYKDFAIVAPQADESVWNPQDFITVAWNVRYQLQPGMQATIYVDGKQQATTTEQIISVTGLERGEHTVTAELKDAQNRRVATADSVTFFIRRPNIYSNRARPTPSGGG